MLLKPKQNILMTPKITHIATLLTPWLGALVPSSLALAQNKADKSPQQKYNVVMIMTDDHTAQMMSCYDKRYVNTPNLDRIADNGVKFTNSFVANSLSGPSRACMLTGKHSHKNGFLSNEMSVFDGTQQTFSKLLQKAGYQTAIVGKWHLETLPTGFDYWTIFPGQGNYYNPDFITMNNDTVRHKGYVTNIVTDLGLNWLEQRDKDKPFVLLMQHKACHRNWLPEMKYLNEYEDKTFDMPDNFDDNYEGRKAASAQEMQVGKHMDIIYDTKMYLPGQKSRLSDGYLGMIGRMSDEEKAEYFKLYSPLSIDFYSKEHKDTVELYKYKFQRYMRDYAKVLKTFDDNVGRVLDYLKQTGLDKNTIVIYASDQGFYMGEHGWFDKRFMYEESMRTPLVMSLPKEFNKRGDVTEMVQNIDYAPTILQLAGVNVPSDMQGVSLLPLLKGQKQKHWRDALYYHFHEYPAEHAVKRHYGIRTKRYKLIHFYNDIDTWELYDLEKDPKEMHNAYNDANMQPVVKKLKKELWKLQEQYDDPIRFKYPLN